MDSILNFILPILFGFYAIYNAVKSLDIVNRVKSDGIKTRAKVIKIRKFRNYDNDGDEIGYQLNNRYNYYYTVKFIDKKGKEFVQELKFPVSKKPNRNPIFEVDIYYTFERNEIGEIILANNNGRNFTFYFILIIGIFFLSIAIVNYDGEIDIILDYLNKLFK